MIGGHCLTLFATWDAARQAASRLRSDACDARSRTTVRCRRAWPFLFSSGPGRRTIQAKTGRSFCEPITHTFGPSSTPAMKAFSFFARFENSAAL